MQEPDGFWKHADTITSVFVHISILIASVAAIVKFRVLNMLSHRYRSELDCRQYTVGDRQIVFEANYTVTNTGGRPIDLAKVHIRLCQAKLQNNLLWADEDSVIVERVIERDTDHRGGNFHIEAGERSIFTLRTVLERLEPVTFVMCQLYWFNKRQPGPYIGMHVRDQATEAEKATAQTVSAGG